MLQFQRKDQTLCKISLSGRAPDYCSVLSTFYRVTTSFSFKFMKLSNIVETIRPINSLEHLWHCLISQEETIRSSTR
jgi:hypothetical protein